MLLVNKEKLSLASDRRLVRASDVATVRGAADIIAAAEAEAAEIREAAKRDGERLIFRIAEDRTFHAVDLQPDAGEFFSFHFTVPSSSIDWTAFTLGLT